MASINLGTFSDGWSGIPYTCYLIHDTPTRSGDNITVKNVKFRIVSQTGQGTEGRTAVTLYMPSGTNRVTNGTIAGSYVYPTDNTYTAVGTTGYTFSNLSTTFSYSVSVSDTGYGSTWNSTYSKTFTGSISCPARTYTVSYNANGGSGAPSSQSKTYNVALTLSSTIPTREGYIFQGWSTSSGGAAVYQPGNSYTSNADVTLYAVWLTDAEIPDDVDPLPITYKDSWLAVTSNLGNVLKNIVKKLKDIVFFKQAEIDRMLGSPNVTTQDFVVGQGAIGGGDVVWVYRKWNSGIAECWCTSTMTISGTGTVWVSPYYYVYLPRPSYPFTFTSAPVEIVSAMGSSVNSFWVGRDADNTVSQTAYYYALKQNGFVNGSTLTVAYFVKGRWK